MFFCLINARDLQNIMRPKLVYTQSSASSHGKSTPACPFMLNEVCNFVHTLHLIHLNKVLVLEGPVLRLRLGSLHETIARVVNRKPKSVFFGRFFSVFPTENRLFKVGFSVAQKNEKAKPTRLFSVGFFFPVPYANNAYIFGLKPRHVWRVF